MKKLYCLCLVSAFFSLALVAMEKTKEEQEAASWLESLFQAAEGEEIEVTPFFKEIEE